MQWYVLNKYVVSLLYNLYVFINTHITIPLSENNND